MSLYWNGTLQVLFPVNASILKKCKSVLNRVNRNTNYHVFSRCWSMQFNLFVWVPVAWWNTIENATQQWQRQNTLHWRHNDHDGVSNHQPHDCLLNRLFRRRSKKHQSSASLAFVWGIHRWPVNSPHKRPVTRKTFPFDDVIMICTHWTYKWYPLSHSQRSGVECLSLVLWRNNEMEMSSFW